MSKNSNVESLKGLLDMFITFQLKAIGGEALADELEKLEGFKVDYEDHSFSDDSHIPADRVWRVKYESVQFDFGKDELYEIKKVDGFKDE